MDYENKLIDAIETIVNNAVENAGYDKTIQAKIITCVDPTIGKYKIQYQDSTFYAYSGSADIIYTDNSDVYILVPGNDMSRDKTILGTTKKLGANYTATPEGDEAYEVIGNNCIDSKGSFELCSYKPETIMLYDKDSENNLLRLNFKSIETYIKQSSSIICGGIIKNNLPSEQQFRGNYGIIFELAFLDNASQNIIIRNYVMDVNQMEGNPYKIPNFRRQYGIYNIDAANFQYVNKIYLFTYNFPNERENMPADIFIKDIEFCGAVASDPDELNSCGLVFITPQGTYFDDNDSSESTRTLQAQVRVKGKNIDNNSQQLDFYWFVENVSVTQSSEKYNVYGGQGWECLNLSNVVKAAEDGADPVIEWTPAGYQKIIKKSDSEARETRYKCVALYNDLKLSKEIVITNYSSNYNITIASDDGNRFYYDIGHPSLTCLVNGLEENSEDYTYIWGEIDNNNNFLSLAETTVENDEYNNAVTGYNQLLADIETETAMAAASTPQLNDYLTTIEKYDTIMRIEKNKIHKVLISSITGFKTYKCSVYHKGKFLGTGSIILYNELETKDMYTLVIDNGSQVFKYNEAGVSPAAGSLDNPIEVLPLGFTVYDNLGRKINDDVIKNCKIKWIIPTEETLIDIPRSQGNPSSVDLINKTETYENILQLNYNISNRYNINNRNNTIRLIVDYKDMNLVAQTDFTFTKEGEPGTNGTDFVCKIVPNTIDDNTSIQPMILNGKLNYTPRNTNKWFTVQLWHNGEKIFDGTETGVSTENKPIIILWQNLVNKYNINLSDTTNIPVIDGVKGIFDYNGYYDSITPANIIKCSVIYDGMTYYATMPMITAKTISGYEVELKAGSGFLYAVYNSDGRSPQYDNSDPFELIVKKEINGIQEDVSELTEDNAISYEWIARGNIYNPVIKEYEDRINLGTAVSLKDLKRNQAYFKPLDEYNGECLNNALEIKLTDKDNNIIGFIHIPIHLLLNKYANAAINDWDGNHVSIDENGSGVILAPQVGAGKKENDNSFTGMLMGEVKESGQQQSDTGLVAYHKGQRTMYLSAYDGYGIFGKRGPGQLILDPTSGNAMLYSNNFWEKYYDDNTVENGEFTTHKNGLPITDYSYDDKKHKYKGQTNQKDDDMQSQNSGMLIDLTTPRILFGSGNFRVDPNGYLYAKGGGQIAGWFIDDYKIHSTEGENGEEKDPTKTGKTGISSVYDGSNPGVTLKELKEPWATADETGYTTDNHPVAFWAGRDKFFVTHEGYLRCQNASIGSGVNPIFIGQSTANGNYSAIYSGKKSQFGANANGFYIGTDGISLGSLNGEGESKFQVTSGGDLTARQGHIGGWNITRNTISAGNVTLSSNGHLTGQNWYIHNNGETKFGNFTVSSTGSIKADGGQFDNITANGGRFNNITASGGTFENITVTGNANIPARCISGLIANSQLNTVNADKISGGTISASNIGIDPWFSVSTDGAILLSTRAGFLRLGQSVNHPYVSALNVSIGSGGLVFVTGTSNSNPGTGTGANINATNKGQLNITCGDDQHVTIKRPNFTGAVHSGGSEGWTGIVTYHTNLIDRRQMHFKYGILVDETGN